MNGSGAPPPVGSPGWSAAPPQAPPAAAAGTPGWHAPPQPSPPMGSPGWSAAPPQEPYDAPAPAPAAAAVSPGGAEGQPVVYWIEELYPDEDYMFKMLQRPGVAGEDGVRIVEVGEGGAFHRAGVRPGRVVSINRIGVFTLHGVKNLLMNMKEAGITTFPISVIPDNTAELLPAYDPRVHGDPSDYDFTARGVPGPTPAAAAAASPQPPAPPGLPAPGTSGLGEDTDEFLARKLQTLAQFRKTGEITEEQYRQSKDRVLMVMLDRDDPVISRRRARSPQPAPAVRGIDAPEYTDHLAAPHPQAPPPPPPPPRSPSHQHPYADTAPTPPLYEWGQSNRHRYIYLRLAPDKDAPWVFNGGVYGVLQILHCIGDWMCVRTDSGVTGFIRARYVTYLPGGAPQGKHAPLPPPPPPADGLAELAPPLSPRHHLPAVVDPVRDFKDYYDPVADRWVRIMAPPETRHDVSYL